MKCKTCIYGNCTGTEVKTGKSIYDCAEGEKLIYIGYSKNECDKWEERDETNVIRIFRR